jgi:hypothetical protein
MFDILKETLCVSDHVLSDVLLPPPLCFCLLEIVVEGAN